MHAIRAECERVSQCTAVAAANRKGRWAGAAAGQCGTVHWYCAPVGWRAMQGVKLVR